MGKIKRAGTWQPREWRLVVEYVMKYFPDYPVKFRVRLGTAPDYLKEKMGPDMAERIYTTMKPWADAIVITPRSVIILEGKIRAQATVLGQILRYKEELYKTPGFGIYKDRPTRMLVIAPWYDSGVEDMLHGYGVETDTFCPEWIADYVKELQHYWTREYRLKREREKES